MNILKEMQKRNMEEIMEAREELVKAWIAKTGYSPERSVLCYHFTDDLVAKFWVEVKPRAGCMDTSGAGMTKAVRQAIRDTRIQQRKIRFANRWQNFLLSIETLKGKIGL